MRPFAVLPLLVFALPVVMELLSPSFLLRWGSRGSGNGQFWIPWDVAIDASGAVYVTDFSTTTGRPHRVQKFSANGAFLQSWGSRGSGTGQFLEPRGIAFHAGRLYVCDTHNRRIQIFETDSTWVGQIGVPAGSYGASQPYDVALDGAGNLYVVDIVNHAVVKFDPQGALVTRWGSLGSGPGQFHSPWSVAIDGAGYVYVADRENHRIQKFDAGGVYVSEWGAKGTGAGQLVWPRGVHVDAQGAIYVTDQIHRVQRFTPAGQFVLQFGTEGILDGQFEFPTGLSSVVVGSMLHLYVVDQESNRIQKFGDAAVPTVRTTWGKLKSLYR